MYHLYALINALMPSLCLLSHTSACRPFRRKRTAALSEESLKNPYMPRMKQENRSAYVASRMRIYWLQPVWDCRVWQRSHWRKLITYTEREQLLLDLLEEIDSLSLNRYCRLTPFPTCSGTFYWPKMSFDAVNRCEKQ